MQLPSLPPRLLLLALATGLTTLPAQGDSLVARWALAPEDRPYVGGAGSNTERGLALNPASGNVLLLSRAGSPAVYVLDARDGADGSETTGAPRTLRLDDESGEFPISGGTFILNLVGAADDGAVFACNLATSLGSVRIYRWADDDVNTPVSVAYSGDPLEGIADPGTGQSIRFGDNFAVRGAGTDTQLLQVARDGKYVLLYTTTDGTTFTPRVLPSPALVGKAGLGVAFDAGNVFWTKTSAAELQRAEFDLTADTVRVLGTVATTIVPGTVGAIHVDPDAQRLAAVDYSAHTLRVFDISNPGSFIQIGDVLAFPAANPNVNGTGAAAIRGTNVFGLDSNNGLLAAAVEISTVAEPPTLTTQPAGATVYAGATVNLAVAVQGTPPFTYQWFFNEAPLPGATSAQLSLAGVTTDQTGTYRVTIANSAGSATSADAIVTVNAPLNTGILQPLWSLNPGDRPYLTSDNTQRGLAYNPATGNLLVVSRSPAPAVLVLDAATGTEKHALRTTTEDGATVLAGGTLPLNMIGVSDDGVVYAANLVTDASGGAASSTFYLYRWENDGPQTVPVLLDPVPELALPERWGDTLDVRGRGATTQILLGSRGLAPQEGQKFALLTSADGFAFNAQVFLVEGVAGSAFGLGLAFGAGNTVFGTANGQPVVHVAFNPDDGTATLVRTYGPDLVPGTVSFLGVHPSSNLLAGVALETPDNVRLYDLATPDAPVLLDQALITPEQPNANGTGAVDFGGDRVFVLDTNHGLRAFEIDRSGTVERPTLTLTRSGDSLSVSWSDGTLETAADLTGPWTPRPGASPQVFAPTEARLFFRARR